MEILTDYNGLDPDGFRASTDASPQSQAQPPAPAQPPISEYITPGGRVVRDAQQIGLSHDQLIQP